MRIIKNLSAKRVQYVTVTNELLEAFLIERGSASMVLLVWGTGFETFECKEWNALLCGARRTKNQIIINW